MPPEAPHVKVATSNRDPDLRDAAHELPREAGTGFLLFHKKKVSWILKKCPPSESMIGGRCSRNNSTSVIFTLVASEKTSKRSKIGSLVAENEHFIVRAPIRGGAKVDFCQSA